MDPDEVGPLGVARLAHAHAEAGEKAENRPALLLLHGFPELAYSWRKIMPTLARAGYHVIAPDQRGYGRTTGWEPVYDGEVASFRMLNVVQDAIALVAAFGYRSVDAVIGHDFGSSVAAWCALVRPDIFRSVVMMSAPFAGTPALPLDTRAASTAETRPNADAMQHDLAALARPRKHYQWYFSTPQAEGDIKQCSQGEHCFLRAYYHVKSADWAGNQPFRLASWAAEELAKMPTYYIMDRDRTMPETVAPFMPTAAGSTPTPGCRKRSSASTAANSHAPAFRLQWYAAPPTAFACRPESVRGPNDRRAVLLHCWTAGLGRLAGSRRPRAHAGPARCAASEASQDQQASRLRPGAGSRLGERCGICRGTRHTAQRLVDSHLARDAALQRSQLEQPADRAVRQGVTLPAPPRRRARLRLDAGAVTGIGAHTHAALHLGPEPGKVAEGLRRYLERAFGFAPEGVHVSMGLYGAKTEGMRSGILGYLIKGIDHAAFRYSMDGSTENIGVALGIRHRGQQGIVTIKRAGTSQNIGVPLSTVE